MRRSFAAALALTAAACSQDVTAPPVRNLDRPSDLVFVCYGDNHLADGDVERSAMPMAECINPVPDEERIAPDMYGFALQSATGTVAVVNMPTSVVIDSDPLTPGKNSIPIGSLPVGLATTPAGCHVVAANAGSCDLSVLDVTAALQQDPAVSRLPVTNAAGDVFLSAPRDMVGPPAGGELGVSCEDTPTGLVYVAYPSCNLVAAIDVASGEIVAGIRFAQDGAATLVGGEIANDLADCPIECGAAAAGRLPAGLVDAGAPADGPSGPDGAAGPDAAGPTNDAAAGTPDAGAADASASDAGPPPPLDPGGPRPAALHMSTDGTRLYIGAERLPAITIVELDEELRPIAVEQIRLEGEVGVTALAASEEIQMGGNLGEPGGTGGPFRFVYAVATDRTVRVADVGAGVECDTQVDPRYLHEVRSAARLSCLEVGAPDTPPRRVGAHSPGIHMPRDGVPLDVAFFTLTSKQDPENPQPGVLVGTFALVTASGGFAYVVNIDDDNYSDFEDADDPGRVYMPLATPHHLRDSNRDRSLLSTSCVTPSAEVNLLGPRLASGFLQAINTSNIATSKAHLLPRPRQVGCVELDADQEPVVLPVPELSFQAPPAIRELGFPDLQAVLNERWSFIWEGTLSLDSALVDVDGPAVRVGVVDYEDGVALTDGTAPFCAMGAEPYDLVRLMGCANETQCGITETCFFHPDQPANVDSGTCLPSDKAQALAGPCREFLIGRRRYTVVETERDRLELIERRRVLRTTPLEGCASDDQCTELAAVELNLIAAEAPADILIPPTVEHTFACEDDPSHRPGPPACVMTCDAGSDCEDGTVCSKGYCVEGVLPPDECVQALQRYEVRVGDAFAVIGRSDRLPTATGFLHRRVADEDGVCVQDPAASPLATGRLPLLAPPCAGDQLTDLDPNPCTTMVDQTEERVVFREDDQGAICSSGVIEVVTRQVPAIRFSNPVFTIHMVGIATSDDHMCLGDEGGGEPAFSPVYTGYTITMEITGGFVARAPVIGSAAFPVEIIPAPDDTLWILDQGDVLSGTVTRGRLIHLFPAADEFAPIHVL